MSLFLSVLLFVAPALQTRPRPNVILIITDDQGHGDLGAHGNPKIRTPNLDKFAADAVEFRRFYVSPVCAPTRASLMTGRYNYRTGVVDTFLGRALMYPGENTIAEMLAGAGYRTGIFGKWHLGDNYPMRPMDQGFQESLVHKGGGIGQPSDPPGGESYFDPILQHNGKAARTRGYCSDVFTDAAIRFISQARATPFFVYLAFNSPHTPLQVPDNYYLPYSKLNLGPSEFPAIGRSIGGNTPQDVTARVYGMVTNIDDNLGRLFAKLDELKLSRDTIVIFLTDNGPQQNRYNSGLRDRKSSVYEGGIRVPFFVRWPGVLRGGLKVDRIAAHIDVAPTLLDLCGIKRPDFLDGISLSPLLKQQAEKWADRSLYIQYHRGDEPELHRAFAVQTQQYKLVQPLGAGPEKRASKAEFELYDIAQDPFEFNNLAARRPDIVSRMRAGYEAWFREVGSTRGYAPSRIFLGTVHE
ncbi:MAG: arylsulfatase, partial [Gammaproteobacteria bacterium]